MLLTTLITAAFHLGEPVVDPCSCWFNGRQTEPSFILLFTPVLLLLWQNVVKRLHLSLNQSHQLNSPTKQEADVEHRDVWLLSRNEEVAASLEPFCNCSLHKTPTLHVPWTSLPQRQITRRGQCRPGQWQTTTAAHFVFSAGAGKWMGAKMSRAPRGASALTWPN